MTGSFWWGIGFDWHSLPRKSVIVAVSGGVEHTSINMLLTTVFSSSSAGGGGGGGGEDLGLVLRFMIQDRPHVIDIGEKVSISTKRGSL